MSIASLIRRAGNGTLIITRKPRKVHAKRARKLRRMGRSVRWTGWTETGKAIYAWEPEQLMRSKPVVAREGSLLQQLADLEAAWSRHLSEPPEEIPSLAQQRTRTYSKSVVVSITTPKGSETVAEWAARMQTLGAADIERNKRQFIDTNLGKPYQAPAMDLGGDPEVKPD